MHVRPALPQDVPAMAALSARDRRASAEVEPGFWRMAVGADGLHRLWIEGLVADGAHVTLVVDDGGTVGWMWAAPLPDRWQVDDWSVADGRWPDAGQSLIDELAGHLDGPRAVTVIGAEHQPGKAACLMRAGFAAVADYRLRRLDGEPGAEPPAVRPAAGDEDADAVVALLATTPAPPHGFPAIGPDTPGGLVVVATDGSAVVGAAVGSPSGPAPPIFDPGGTTCVADRVVGARQGDLLAGLEHHARIRGDVQLLVIVDADDHPLRAALDHRRYRHPVKLWARRFSRSW